MVVLKWGQHNWVISGWKQALSNKTHRPWNRDGLGRTWAKLISIYEGKECKSVLWIGPYLIWEACFIQTRQNLIFYSIVYNFFATNTFSRLKFCPICVRLVWWKIILLWWTLIETSCHWTLQPWRKRDKNRASGLIFEKQVPIWSSLFLSNSINTIIKHCQVLPRVTSEKLRVMQSSK